MPQMVMSWTAVMLPIAWLMVILLGSNCCLRPVHAENGFLSRGLLFWQSGQGQQWWKLPAFQREIVISGTNPITKETKSLAIALAAGGGEAEAVSLAQEVKENGEETTAETYAKALSDGQSAAVAISFASASQKGGEEAKAASKVLAQTFGRGNPSAVATAVGEAYSKDQTAVASTLADAIVLANNNGNRRAVAESTAEAISKGGEQAAAFSEAYAQAVSEGKCEQVADSFAEAIAIAEDKGSAIAQAIAEADATIADCVFRDCANIAQGCCQAWSISRGKCFCPPWQSWCNWNLLTTNPFPVWETDQRGWARNRYCKCK